MDPARISMLALVFVGLRVLHGVFYIAGIAALRSLAWAGWLWLRYCADRAGGAEGHLTSPG